MADGILAQLSSASAAEEFFALLWRHSFDARQKRKVAGRWLRSLVRSVTA